MNILDKMPFLNGSNDQPEMTDAEAKSERARFHREKVRNGPSAFRSLSNGQIRRAQKRAEATRARKTRSRQIRSYLAQQREAAAIRGNLQAAGVLPYHGAVEVIERPAAAHAGIVWIVQHFAEAPEGETIEVTREVVVQSLTAALNRWQAIVGIPVTPLSPAYQLPATVSA